MWRNGGNTLNIYIVFIGGLKILQALDICGIKIIKEG